MRYVTDVTSIIFTVCVLPTLCIAISKRFLSNNHCLPKEQYFSAVVCGVK